MNRGSWVIVTVLGFCVAFVPAPLCRAQNQSAAIEPAPSEISQRMQELEKQVSDLRSELAVLKQNGSMSANTKTTTQTEVAQSNLVTQRRRLRRRHVGRRLRAFWAPHR